MTSLNQTKIAFLLGSGVSISVGRIPPMKEITKRILSGKGIMRRTDGTYDLGHATEGFMNEYIDKSIKFLKRIKIEADSYYCDSEVNYEDLYYMANQINDSEYREYDNPVVQPFIDKIIPDIEKLLTSKEGEHLDEWTLAVISHEVINYIKCVVWRILSSKKPEDTNRLRFFKDACLDKDSFNVDIFTLNHDTILEDYLTQTGIKLMDGFGDPENGVRYWNPYLFVEKPSEIKFFKLHGSLNWFMLCSKVGNRTSTRIGIPLNGDYWHTKDSNGRLQDPVNKTPEFLVGTFNKMFDYTSSIYAEMHCRFYYRLRDIEQVVICGYGFGDKGINRRLIEWVYSSLEHKFIIIDPDPNLKERSRGIIANNWDSLSTQNKLVFIQDKIENISWQDIKNRLKK